jgi:hypothetical protein
MKPLTRYISLLLVCGLMLPLHHHDINIIGKHNDVGVHLSKPVRISQASNYEHREYEFSFFKDVLVNVLPALKILR